MTQRQATAEVYWLAFRSLPSAEQEVVMERFVEDHRLRRDLLDLATVTERRDEPGRDLRIYLSERESEG